MKKYILMLAMLVCAGFFTASCEKENANEMNETYAVVQEETPSTDNTTANKSIPIGDLPTVITDYIAANYPDATIVEAEREENGSFEVELDNGLEIKFDAEGNFLKEESDEHDEDHDGDNDDDDKIAIEDLPTVITDYIAANYPDATIVEAEREENGSFEVELDNGLEIKFDADGNFLEEESDEHDEDHDSDGDGDNDDDDKIAIEDLPAVITDYIAANYPDATIVEAEREENGSFEVELDNGLEIKFDADGNFLEEESDEHDEDHDSDGDGDNDDDDKIAIEDLPAVITDYIAANYPDATIVEAEKEEDGGFEVELDNGLELIFDADGNFVKED